MENNSSNCFSLWTVSGAIFHKYGVDGYNSGQLDVGFGQGISETNMVIKYAIVH